MRRSVFVVFDSAGGLRVCVCVPQSSPLIVGRLAMKLAVIARHVWLLLPLLAANPTLATAQWTEWSGSAPVNTSSGAITGHAATNKTDVLEYLGIPYAQPPVGQLRFAPPQPYTSFQPFNASSYVSINPSLV